MSEKQASIRDWSIGNDNSLNRFTIASGSDLTTDYFAIGSASDITLAENETIKILNITTNEWVYWRN